MVTLKGAANSSRAKALAEAATKPVENVDDVKRVDTPP
ncbi:MAG: hypothetical protein ACOH1Q_10960 [Thiobacillus sp.]